MLVSTNSTNIYLKKIQLINPLMYVRGKECLKVRRGLHDISIVYNPNGLPIGQKKKKNITSH